MRGSLIILSFFAVGVLLGFSDIIPSKFSEIDWSSYALYALMFLVGIGIGADKSALKVLVTMRLKIFFVPLAVIIGSLAGAGFISIFLSSISFKESLAVGAGFGYYSLSSIIITKISGDTLGVIALLSNVMREIMTLLLAAIMVRYFGKLAPIASGGATSMDTTLPIITEYSGKDYAMIAVFNGIILTIVVPVLVTFILNV